MCRFPIFASKPINMKRPLMLMCAISICAALFAQPYSDREESFTLTRYAGHYMFTADINGTAPATIMLESGIPALLVDSAFAFGSGCFRDMHLEASDRSINLGGDKFRISHTANGTVCIGRGTSYRGKIWILSGYADHREISIPLQYFYNEADNGSSIMYIDLAGGHLDIYCRDHMNSQELKDWKVSRINTRTYMDMPAVKTVMTVREGGRDRKLKGNYVIDFGNAEMMALFNHDKKVQKFLDSNSDMQLQDAKTPGGQVIGQIILSDECTLLGKTIPDAVILITRTGSKFTSQGLLGLKFFLAAPVILDFDRSRFYVK